MDYSTKGRYGMILGRDVLTALGLDLKMFYHVIEADGGSLKGLLHPWLIWVRMSLNI